MRTGRLYESGRLELRSFERRAGQWGVEEGHFSRQGRLVDVL